VQPTDFKAFVPTLKSDREGHPDGSCIIIIFIHQLDGGLTEIAGQDNDGQFELDNSLNIQALLVCPAMSGPASLSVIVLSCNVLSCIFSAPRWQTKYNNESKLN